MKKFLFCFISFWLLSASTALALPALQLDIEDGVYVASGDKTVYATTNPFTLYALLDNPAFVGKLLYYQDFLVDISGLTPDLSVHFDLFTFDNSGKLIKAPFSHDAQSGGGPPIPEPATLLLLGTGLIGIAGLGRRKLAK